MAIHSERMVEETFEDAFVLLRAFLREDAHYLESSAAYGDGGDDGIRNALRLFVVRPELGFVWLSYDETRPVAVCIVSFAISTSAGAVVAKLDDVFVTSGRQGETIGTSHLDNLKAELRRLSIPRLDTSVHVTNTQAQRFYEKNDFMPLHEHRLTCHL